MARFLGVARERICSPGKVDADRGILEAVAARLADRHRVEVVSSDDELSRPDSEVIVFTMCQGPTGIDIMRSWESAGVLVVNSADAIENCHRHRMQPLLEHGPAACPDGVLVSSEKAGPLPDWLSSGAWVKRGDVHATQSGDVVFVRDEDGVRAVLEDFSGRGIGRALIQRHVEGEVIKFYAVRGAFFEYFASNGSLFPEEEVSRMRVLADTAAEMLGLAIFGGDCVRAPDGSLWLIDLNDWPSYGRCRSSAAAAIAGYLETLASRSTRNRGESS